MRLLQLAGAGEIEITISKAIISEVVRVLGDKFTWPAGKLQAAERTIRNLCTVVTPLRALSAVPDDPDDDRIIECAVAAGSEAVVTGDRDLLRLQTFENVKIVSVANFLASI